jgi:hypothetical protein
VAHAGRSRDGLPRYRATVRQLEDECALRREQVRALRAPSPALRD